jgi:5-methylcytosine-specific restriction endonuclease McrA
MPNPIMTRESISAELERRVREAARHRCGYCLSPQRLVMARLEIEHILPVAKGGDRSETNLWLSCPLWKSQT